MNTNRARFKNVIFDRSLGADDHLRASSAEMGETEHEIKMQAVSLLLDALDCMHEMSITQTEGQQIDQSAVLAIQRRMERLLSSQRNLNIQHFIRDVMKSRTQVPVAGDRKAL